MNSLSCYLRIALLGWLLITYPASAQEQPLNGDPRTISIAYAEDWPPFSYQRKSGQPAGILVEIANFLLGDQLGYQITHTFHPWQRAQKLVKEGIHDALLAVPNQDRNRYTTANSSEIYSMQVRAFISKRSPRADRLLAMDNPLHHPEGHYSLLLGDKTCEGIYDDNQAGFVTINDMHQVVKMLATGRSDLFLHSKVAAIRGLIELNMESKVRMHPTVFKQVPLYLLVSEQFRNQDNLISSLDSALGQLKRNQQFAAIIDQIEREEILYSLEYAELQH
ncbi:substrate-binding periplasmic protein [Motiliproteus sp.]|uniref:substrate-binding periplasmic protein n=1 Tax=Motiliproteus sp. TaxID=1898955 RepID=UPI003BA9E515